MAFNLFKRKKKEFDFPEGTDIDIPPAPPSIHEEAFELPTFPSIEEFDVEKAVGQKPKRAKKTEIATSDIEEIERNAISAVQDNLEERENLELKTPLFVEANLYKGVIDDLGVLKAKLKDNADRLLTLGGLTEDKEKTYSVLQKQTEDMQRKLIYVDNTLFSKR
jgi:hypothetical protein